MSYLILFLSVAVGASAVLLWKPEDRRKVRILTAFGGAYILSITSLHLLPEVFAAGGSEHVHVHESSFPLMGIFLLLGFFIQLMLDYFSHGIEHGHAHVEHSHGHIPWGMMAGLCIHAYLEGTPLAHASHAGHAHSISMESRSALLGGIVMHNVPVSVVFMMALLQSGVGRGKSLVLLAVFALMSPLGMLTAESVELVAKYQRELMAVVIGIFLHLSTTILFETGEEHRFNRAKILAIIGGILVAIAGSFVHFH